jgi:hypothetical protein
MRRTPTTGDPASSLCSARRWRCRLRGAPAGSEAAPCGRWSALHQAAYNGHGDAMCALLIAGANVAITNSFGYGARYRAGACEPKGNAPADAACSETAEDVAKERGHAAAYADAVKRVRLPAHLQAHPCACVRASVCVACARVRVVCKCGYVSCPCPCSACMLCGFACVRACLHAHVSACAVRLRMPARARGVHHVAMRAQSAFFVARLSAELHAPSFAPIRIGVSDMRQNRPPRGTARVLEYR